MMRRIIAFAAVLAFTGCARQVELHHGRLATGEDYSLVYRRTRLPFGDHGWVYLRIGMKSEKPLEVPLAAYDMYVDPRLHAIERASGLLFVRDDRLRARWSFDSQARTLKRIDYQLDDAPPVGAKHWR